MKARRYKNSVLMKTYEACMSRGPDDFMQRKGGAIQCAFMNGFEGNATYKYDRRSTCWAAYMAGKDYKAMMTKGATA